MRIEPTPINIKVRKSTGFRPIRSPRWPKTIAPTGRATNPTPNVAKDAKRAPVDPRSLKKRVGNRVADNAPYTAKSKYSSAEPREPLTTARSSIPRVAGAGLTLSWSGQGAFGHGLQLQSL